MRMPLFFKELGEVKDFFSERNADARRLMFYSENEMYYQYYESTLQKLCDDGMQALSYITSDDNDVILNNHLRCIHPFYINSLLAQTITRLDAGVLVMTMPDLNQFHIKRAKGKVNHVYMFHALVSTHMQYREGAFDYYDTVFCVGPHHIEEIRKREEKERLPKKNLVEIGYPWLEQLYHDHQTFKVCEKNKVSQRPCILIASTWGEQCILNTCIEELVEVLKAADYQVVIRPHPEFMKREKRRVERLKKVVCGTENIQFEHNLSSAETIHRADVLITDRSGIAFEYSFATERPVLFIDTPLKICNPRYEMLGIEPIENILRSEVGIGIAPENVSTVSKVIRELLNQKQEHSHVIAKIREAHVFNWLTGADKAAEYLKK